MDLYNTLNGKQTQNLNIYLLKYIHILFIILLLLLIILNEKNIKKETPFFFEQIQEKLNYCSNYGILVYNYPYDGKVKYGNIGDYIQSLASLQYLPKNCKPYLIDRDNIRFYNGPKVKLIMNGWNFLNDGNKYVSKKISPIYISYHLNIYKNLPSIYLNEIKKYCPIGCRDKYTRDKLLKFKINAYFSSCLTTTLDIDYAVNNNERTEEIIFVDYKLGDYPKADKYLLSLKEYNFKKIIYTTHYFNIKLSHIKRFQIAKNLLNKYARVKLVISTRIHGALPCLALNTPVILINKKYDYKRFNGLYELLNTIGINYNGKFEIKVNVNDNGFVYNSNKFLEYSIKLKDKLRNI